MLPSPRLQTPSKYSHAFLVIFTSALLLTGCGAVGSSPTPTPEANPVPTISSVSPSTIIAGAMASTLTINGGGFIQSSTVQWNQSNRTTTFVSSTQLQVALTVADLALGETAQIVIVNPAPGGGASSAVTFTINNPVPTISAVSPSTLIVGAMTSTITIDGGGFIQNSSVQWNQINRTTTFVSSTELQVALTPSDLAVGGTAQIVVANPAPGGGASSAVPFTINNPAPQISGISPSTVSTIDGGSTVTVTGAGFVSNSSVTWNTAARTTTYVSATQLQFKLLASDVATVGSPRVQSLLFIPCR